MARFYGIYIKDGFGRNRIINLSLVSGFERTGNLKSNKLYFLKEIINLTSKYDNECDFKYVLYVNGVIELDDINKEIFICSKDKDDKPGKIRLPIIYKSLSKLFEPNNLKMKYMEKCDVTEDYYFLEKLVKYYSRYRTGYKDSKRYTSEIIIDEINSIIKNYNPSGKFNREHIDYYTKYKDYFSKRVKELLDDFVNHEVFYVIGKTPSTYERKVSNVYRIDKKTNEKQIDLYSLYKLVVFFVESFNNNASLMGKACDIELEKLKEELTLLENEINLRKEEREQYKKEAILLAEEDMKDFLNPDIDEESIEIERRKNLEIERGNIKKRKR